MNRRTFFALLPAAALLALTPLAPAQDWAKSRLDASPRHREYVPIKSGARTVNTFVVYPESPKKAPVVVLIHEIFGLSDWAKSMADDLAAEGYIVLAPDLLSGTGPSTEGKPAGGTDSYPSMDAITKAVSSLPADQVTADLDAVADFGLKLPASNGKLAVTGFCWGGGKTFAFATHRKDIQVAGVFYGPPPETSAMASIAAPVYGFYAANDARIDATIPATTEAMKAAGKKYDPVTYDGAGHGFMRAGLAPDATPANKAAREEAFKRLTALLKPLQ
jgi:carboxymethylenebutenolidase